uniref:Large ribosomal subunit protein uL13c n=1 Tax=Astrosyne radiata TaxID=1158023 RepID=A0A2U9NTB3_9STRA|nr:ribosomal protein L13 [Astrosyne radiata]AWT40371.1 ribosomal protein L13 [Astrosyne radiata]
MKNTLNTTFQPNKSYNTCNWFLIDCKNQTLGRLSSFITTILRGKKSIYYYPSVFANNYIILINVDLIRLSKCKKHFLVYNPGKPGRSLKVKDTKDCLTTFIIKKSIKGMLSKNERKHLINKVKIYSGHIHPHTAQNPKKLRLSKLK